MYALSDAAAKDIEHILDRSVVDFGLHQTDALHPFAEELPGTPGRESEYGQPR